MAQVWIIDDDNLLLWLNHIYIDISTKNNLRKPICYGILDRELDLFLRQSD